ncbi:MAG: pirin family protein [Cytophagaceae bacterium]
MKKIFVISFIMVILSIAIVSYKQANGSCPETNFNDYQSIKDTTMKYVLHKANTRGEFEGGWLKARYSFSFNTYYDPARMNFGVLRVLNDDRIDPAKGFGTHPHDNMEIITIPLQGAVEHKDNMGNHGIIRAGDVQVMSAGKGVRHSEVNPSSKDTLKLLQIWVFPNKKDVQPRYQQMNGITNDIPVNTFKKLVAPDDEKALFVYQNVVFSMGEFKAGARTEYNIAYKGNGVYVFIIEGNAKINGVDVTRRDGIGIWNTDKLQIEIQDNSKILLMDVPMIN